MILVSRGLQGQRHFMAGAWLERDRALADVGGLDAAEVAPVIGRHLREARRLVGPGVPDDR